jgi:hypothetical protein
MGRKTYDCKQIYDILTNIEFHLSQGLTLCFACRKTGITEQTYYRWRKEQGNMLKGCDPSILTTHVEKYRPEDKPILTV